MSDPGSHPLFFRKDPGLLMFFFDKQKAGSHPFRLTHDLGWIAGSVDLGYCVCTLLPGFFPFCKRGIIEEVPGKLTRALRDPTCIRSLRAGDGD